MRGLDEYITNSKCSEWWEELICSKCGSVWEAIIFSEYGRSYFKDEDKTCCPECGTVEGTEVMDGNKVK